MERSMRYGHRECDRLVRAERGAAGRCGRRQRARLDRCLVNNAAVELQRRFHTLALDGIERVLRVDLLTPIELVRRSGAPSFG